MILTSKATLQINKPIEEVFEGIVAPEKMTKYFISESSDRLDSGVDLVWKFPEFPETFPITKIVVESPNLISFVWDPETNVTITLKEWYDHSTVVNVEENGKEYSENNLEWLLSNTAGWANFLACLKAYLEYGIELRKGAFDFMRKT